MEVHPSAVEVDLEDATASFDFEGEIFDDHDLKSSLTRNYPPGYPRTATVEFHLKWEGVLDRGMVTNTSEGFTGEYIQDVATIKWSSEQDGFRFESEDPNPARNVASVIGRERNGVFAQSGDDDD